MELYTKTTDEELIAKATIILLNYRVGGYYVPTNNNFCIHCHGFKTDNPSIIIHYGAMDELKPIAVFTKAGVLYPFKQPDQPGGFSRNSISGLLDFLQEATKAKMEEINKVVCDPSNVKAPPGFTSQNKG